MYFALVAPHVGSLQKLKATGLVSTTRIHGFVPYANCRSYSTSQIHDSIRSLRKDLAKCYRVADRFGLSEGVCNHFTVALPGDRADEFLVIPYGKHWSKVLADDLIVVKTDGTSTNPVASVLTLFILLLILL